MSINKLASKLKARKVMCLSFLQMVILVSEGRHLYKEQQYA